jgi:protein-L-isoaspartate(D-aspartate) O-methyltransferase
MPVGWGATITDPDVVSMMTTTLDVKPDSKVLEIGTGSGYQSAILSHLTDYVYSIEIIEPLYRETNALYNELTPSYPNYSNIRRKLGDGFFGWEKYAPFDRIIVTCAIDHLPPPLIQQLNPGGIMVVPLGPPGRQNIMEVKKTVDDKGNVSLTRRDVYNGLGVRFIPFRSDSGQSYSGAARVEGGNGRRWTANGAWTRESSTAEGLSTNSRSASGGMPGFAAKLLDGRLRWLPLAASGLLVLALGGTLLAWDYSLRRDQRLATLPDYALSCVTIPGGAGSDIAEPLSEFAEESDVVLVGETNLIRPEEIIHVVVSGDTIYGIAGKYGIDPAVLALHNKLARPSLLSIGQRLRIPSTEEERRLKPAAKGYSLAPPPAKKVTSVEIVRRKLEISAEQQIVPEGLSVRFSATARPSRDQPLGVGAGQRRPRVQGLLHYTYTKPGTYLVTGIAVDKAGLRYSGEKLMVDLPHPHTSMEPGVEFAVVDSPDGHLVVDGQVLDGPAVTREVLEGGGTRLSFPQSGYYRFSVSSGEAHRTLFVFVAPMDSVISDRKDLDWYRTQFNTGTHPTAAPPPPPWP